MAIPLWNLPQDSMHFTHNPKNKTNLKSFWAFLFSIFIYLSVFYFLNLSPSTLLCTTKFWFFILNTLVLIIAVDFDDFSSSEKCDDFYEKNALRPKHDFYALRAKNDIPPSVSDQYDTVVAETTSHQKEEEPPQEKILKMIEPTSADYIIDEHKPQILSSTEELEENKQEIVPVSDNVSESGKTNKEAPACLRSSSDIGTAVKAAAEETEDKAGPVLQRSLSERYDEEARLEENELWSMSNEELNRRVEEFIRNFNREMMEEARRSMDLH